MNKRRLENLSDGIFAIVLTLLVLGIKIPQSGIAKSDEEIWAALQLVFPSILAYFASFLILGTYWLSHSYVVSVYAKNVSRKLVALNLIFLSLISLIPFSAELVGINNTSKLSVLIFGINILCISLLSLAIFIYVLKSKKIKNIEIGKRRIRNTYFRLSLPIFGCLLGMISIAFSTELALTFYVLPVAFNFFPGSLTEVQENILRRFNRILHPENVLHSK